MTTYFIETDDGARKGPYATREAAREAISHESPNWVWIVDREPYADPAPAAAKLQQFWVQVRAIRVLTQTVPVVAADKDEARRRALIIATNPDFDWGPEGPAEDINSTGFDN